MSIKSVMALRDNLKEVICGKDSAIDLLITALLSRSHILLDDVPGVGKTTLAKALAKSIDGVFQRVQFTPDLLPSDIIGSLIYNPKNSEFFFRKGPIFANIFLADEINRASPRTQSALLEAMNESQITIEGTSRELPEPFIVIATENPIEYQGTYQLPEAQLDRFAMQYELGYPSEEAEMEIIASRKFGDPLKKLKSVISCSTLSDLQNDVTKVNIEKSLTSYATAIIRETRIDSRVQLGASPRALLALIRSSQAKAFIKQRDYVLPDDIKSLAVPVLSHRIVLESRAKYSGVDKKNIIKEIITKISSPS